MIKNIQKQIVGLKMNKKRTTITYTALAIAIVVAAFSVYKMKDLKQRLNTSSDERMQLSSEVKSYKHLLRIDSMLVKGKYEDAISAYQMEKNNKDMGDITGVQLRIDLAQSLLRMKVNENAYRSGNIKFDSLDSIQSGRQANIGEINRYDSLSFALEKTKVQLRSMRSQLKRKSFGEYITFKSKKGNQMHYVGEVKNNQANGLGVAILNTGSRYEGEWKANERHGEGTFYWPDGEYYVGSYKEDKRNGLGTYYWPNGEKYVGQWSDDKRNGKGVFYGKDGVEITSGIWKKDKLVTEEKK